MLWLLKAELFLGVGGRGKGSDWNVDKSAGEDRAGGEGRHGDKEGPRRLHGSLLGLRTYPKET